MVWLLGIAAGCERLSFDPAEALHLCPFRFLNENTHYLKFFMSLHLFVNALLNTDRLQHVFCQESIPVVILCCLVITLLLAQL